MRPIQNIAYVTEGDTERDPAFERVITMAENNQAQVTVLYVWEDIPADSSGPAGDLRELLRRRSREHFEHLTRDYRERVPLKSNILFGVPFIEIIRDVLAHGRDLVVKSPSGESGLKDRLFSSTDMHLLRKCPSPVWLLKPSDPKRYRRILAAVDFTPAAPRQEDNDLNRQILEVAVSLAISEFSELHVVHAWEAPAARVLHVWGNAGTHEINTYIESERRSHEQVFQQFLADLPGWVGADATAYAKPQRHLLRGAAREVIPALAKNLETDLIVMGTVGRTGIPGLFIGNTAENILNRIDCSVYAVKPSGFVSPVK